ncbi:hypothetical protein [Streptomyces sp. NPDC047042]|uniref:hypothetical protein n=1 Tax=Streptomyces sp. NPDC047042 TaxID=3154807 RepID=UPI0033EEC626
MEQLLAVLAGGVLALGGSLLQARHQRQQAHDERVWTRRADLYVDLLSDSDNRELKARVQAFASDRVQQLYEPYKTAYEQRNFYALENGGVDDLGEFEPPDDAEMRRLTPVIQRNWVS